MKWRCTWCGKPHAEDDPPCDACGHNTFEKAVVRREGEAPPRTETVDTGTTYVWVCPNCGREHVRYNPPCARCGEHDLEKTEQTYDSVDRDLDVPGWLEVAKPYVPAFAVIGLVALLFAAGIVSPSILPGIGHPSPPDAPGDGTEVAGIDLEETELLVHERLESERTGGGTRYDDDLAAFAEYHNRAFVAQEYDDANPDPAGRDEFGVDCSVDPASRSLSLTGSPIDDYNDEAALADDIAAALLASSIGDDVRTSYPGEGLDVHATDDGAVHVTYVSC
ncbi:hypothetical protein [Natronococcus wangiae]|uniref:hypothetical protein n=1 Tax=Natronococcus wangiae TaxID=3068275 RepID=UPI00273D7C24|nr:hypothetical protein [Natronococcus sp. AD5]